MSRGCVYDTRMAPLNIAMPSEMKTELSVIAKQERRSIGEIVRRFIEEKLKEVHAEK
jgi:predicted DNA-binding protein